MQYHSAKSIVVNQLNFNWSCHIQSKCKADERTWMTACWLCTHTQQHVRSATTPWSAALWLVHNTNNNSLVWHMINTRVFSVCSNKLSAPINEHISRRNETQSVQTNANSRKTQRIEFGHRTESNHCSCILHYVSICHKRAPHGLP